MNATVLKRETFKTNRELEFFSEKELQMQIGHSKESWPIALIKELIDNSLDACETVGVLPEIEISVEDDGIYVKDNGPGLPEKTLQESLDYMARVSDKNHYISPSRGQLGNALKCVYAVPFVLNGDLGQVDIITRGKLHKISVTIDKIAQKPSLWHTISNNGFVKNGTFVKIYLPEIAGLVENTESCDFYNSAMSLHSLIGGFTAFNPHASFTYKINEKFSERRTIDSFQKWSPSNPTSAHWYSVDRLKYLISAYLSIEREGSRARTVREFVSEFRGLKSTSKQKRVTETVGLSRAHLHDLVKDNDLDISLLRNLLIAMQHNSQPVKPRGLGVIGEDYFRQWMVGNYVSKNSIRYKMIAGESNGLPFVLETAFGINREAYAGCGREIITGLNWSPTLDMPFLELSWFLNESHVEGWDPVSVIVHLACPILNFTDRGKSKLHLPGEIHNALYKAVKSVSKDFRKIKKRLRREQRIQDHDLEMMRKQQKRRKLSAKAAAFEVMEQAYMKASSNGTLPANARQLMYAARPLVINLTGKAKPWKHSSYFTQTLLPEFIENHPKLTADWDVVYDARGKLVEPHTGKRVDLGTVEVRKYINNWLNNIRISDVTNFSFPSHVDTSGPVGRYRFALFVEKEGFNELFENVNLANRYDIAIMSTKGMTVTAARRLAESLTEKGVAILVIRDFDKSGFSIVHTLKTSSKRYTYETLPNVVDLGLRIEDVEQMGLQCEDVTYESEKDPRINILESGATEEEADFLVSGGHPKAWKGERVELNAMDSEQLVGWLENKLKEVGVFKVIPDEKVLVQTFRKAYKETCIEREIKKAIRKYDDTFNKTIVPTDIREQVAKSINDTTKAWDQAIKSIAVYKLNND